jgi:hypothetical protein
MILKYRCLCALWIGFFTLFASFASYSQTQIALKDIPALVKDNLPHLNAKKI